MASLSMRFAQLIRRPALPALLLLMATPAACAADLRLDGISLPPGFAIELYAANVPGAP